MGTSLNRRTALGLGTMATVGAVFGLPDGVAAAPGGAVAPAVSGPVIPPEGMLNDLAVHDQTAGPHGSFYVATSHPLEPLWWFDGTGTWFPSQLGTLPPAELGAVVGQRLRHAKAAGVELSLSALAPASEAAA